MKTFDEIVNPYLDELKSIDYSKQSEWSFDKNLLSKWKSHIPKGWYGFDLGGTPPVWSKIIDEFLDELVKVDPSLEIHQIKLKFGGIRFYVQVKETPEIASDIDKLERMLSNRALIY